ncbi:MAG TPA: FAD-dependent oxidoreductase [Vicinamibacterales bacterium]|nr:FAD-dependent oxidoreductase [Vicinamibacterales bacterium]
MGAIGRREWIVKTGLATAGLALGGCATRRPASAFSAYDRALSRSPFVRPRILADQVIRTVVGLRPYRPSGFVVRGERMGEKLVVHNYGHGGGGITLSWGSSALAVREAPPAVGGRRAAVIGAGIMGLTTARLLQDRGWSVTIYAKALPPHTTSNIAGGQWAPTSVFEESRATAAFQTQYKEAARLAHHAFGNLVGSGYGVSWKENYFLNARRVEPRADYYLRELPELFPSLKELGPDEHPFPSPFVYRFVTMLVEPSVFLRRTLTDIREAGGRVEVREFRDVSEVLALEEPAIFNCTGLGAGALFGDTELVPVRGQLVFMPPDDRLDYLTIGGGEGTLFMFPRPDGILLGGTFERGASHLAADAGTTARILRDHARIAEGMRVA